MEKYVHIFYNRLNKTQRFVITGADDCLASIEKKLEERGALFTNSKFMGRYQFPSNYKEETYKYAKKWQWLNTIDLTR